MFSELGFLESAMERDKGGVFEGFEKSIFGNVKNPGNCLNLGGGNSNMFYFHHEKLGKMNPFWHSYVSKGLVQPPTSKGSSFLPLVPSGCFPILRSFAHFAWNHDDLGFGVYLHILVGRSSDQSIGSLACFTHWYRWRKMMGTQLWLQFLSI